jgi:pilus assembly protein FimV
MHLRKLLILLGVLSLLVSRSVLALGLGDISLNSSLNQPLDAHIGLHDLGELSGDQIVVKLGSQEDFDKIGLERSFFYTQLRFNVITEGKGAPFVAVTSRDPVREPYLSFVVDMRWTSGRVMREYTVLLDLPTFSGEDAAAVQGSVTPVRSSRQPAQNEPSPSTSSGASRGANSYGPVKATDTLWEIARDHRPGNASIHQTMLAIQKANPKAFIRNNINLMRKGQVLRIPSESEIRALNNRRAISSVAEQNREWSGKTMGAQLDASGRNAARTSTSGEVSGRLRLASGSGVEAGQGQNAGAGASGTEQLEGELAETKDELARTRGENSELRSRVSDLESQIETMERLLAVSNEQLRALEVAAEQQDTPAPSAPSKEPLEPTAEPDDTVAEASAAQAADAADSKAPTAAEPEQQADGQATPAATAQTSEPESKPKRNVNKVIRRAPEPTLMDKLFDNLLWLVLALVVVIGLGVWLLRKRQEDDDEQDSFEPEHDHDQLMDFDAPQQDADAPLSAEADAELAEQFDEPAPEVPEEDEAGSTEAETGDVVGEADIYIALGKYDQAEDMLLAALERDPGSMAISLKLLEVYAEGGNLTAFDERYSAIVEQGDQDAIARAESLRTQHFPGAAEFVAPAAATALQGAESDAAELASSDSSVNLDDDDINLTDDLEFEFPGDEEGRDDELSLEGLESDDSATSGDALDLDEANHSYDLSFDLDDEDEQQAQTSESHDASLADDELTLSLAEDSAEPETGAELDDLSFELEDDSASDANADADADTSLDLDLDLALDLEDEPADEASSESPLAEDDAAVLEGDLTLDTGDTDQAFDTPLTEQADTDDAPQADREASAELPEDEVPTLDLADDDADDFDLDKAMEGFDLASMDEGLEALDEPSTETVSESLEQTAFLDSDDTPAEDATFEEALANLDESPELPEEAGDATGESAALDSQDDDFDFLADSDEVTTKLDLARAYIDMGDLDGARDILAEVAAEGNDEQKAEAQSLLDKAK